MAIILLQIGDFMITEERTSRIDDILTRKQTTLQVMLDDVASSQNISAIIRSCDGVGVLNFYYASTENVDAKIHKTITQGTHRWINRKRIDYENRVAFLKEKQAKGFQIVVTHLEEKSVSFSKIDYTKPTVLVMGNEKDGISDEVLTLADEVIIIPMRGMAQSLNVSVATGLILYEAQRQFDEAGAYDTPQISEEKREEIKKEWIYRDVIRDRSKGKVFY